MATKRGATGVDAASFRATALALEGVEEGAHMGHADFRVGGRIFASLRPEKGLGTVKLTPEDQALRREVEPQVFTPAAGAWGLQGWTQIALGACSRASLDSALTAAWRLVGAAPPKKPKAAKRPATKGAP